MHHSGRTEQNETRTPVPTVTSFRVNSSPGPAAVKHGDQRPGPSQQQDSAGTTTMTVISQRSEAGAAAVSLC